MSQGKKLPPVVEAVAATPISVERAGQRTGMLHHELVATAANSVVITAELAAAVNRTRPEKPPIERDDAAEQLAEIELLLKPTGAIK